MSCIPQCLTQICYSRWGSLTQLFHSHQGSHTGWVWLSYVIRTGRVTPGESESAVSFTLGESYWVSQTQLCHSHRGNHNGWVWLSYVIHTGGVTPGASDLAISFTPVESDSAMSFTSGESHLVSLTQLFHACHGVWLRGVMLVVNFCHIMFTSYITVFLSKKKNITYCNSFKVICSRTYAMKMYLLSIEVKDVCNVYISNMVSNTVLMNI